MNRIRSFLLVICFGVPTCLSPQAIAASSRPPDQAITQQVESEFRNDRQLRDAEIDVRAVAGHVTLTGATTNYRDKIQAERLCKKIDGIRGVSNIIRVEPALISDAAMARAVMQRWKEDGLLRYESLSAIVERRVVTLEGEVGSRLQRRRAEELAREVRGVRLIRNEVKIAASGRAPQRSPSRSDSDVKENILSMIDRDRILFGSPIEVRVESGVVTLTGDAADVHQRNWATNRVRMLPGVRRVDNQMIVGRQTRRDLQTDQPFADRDLRLARNVRVQLQSDPTVDASKIRVESSNGFVFVRGSVPSLYQKHRVTRIAQEAKGVRWISNDLGVDDEGPASKNVLSASRDPGTMR